jgi:uncharacterized membrane protein YvbJ
MKKCPECGYVNANDTPRCPECGGFYSKIIQLIEQAAAEEESQTWRGRCQRIWSADNRKQAVKRELEQFKASLTVQAKLALWVIFAFVFALIVTVL